MLDSTKYEEKEKQYSKWIWLVVFIIAAVPLAVYLRKVVFPFWSCPAPGAGMSFDEILGYALILITPGVGPIIASLQSKEKFRAICWDMSRGVHCKEPLTKWALILSIFVPAAMYVVVFLTIGYKFQYRGVAMFSLIGAAMYIAKLAETFDVFRGEGKHSLYLRKDLSVIRIFEPKENN